VPAGTAGCSGDGGATPGAALVKPFSPEELEQVVTNALNDERCRQNGWTSWSPFGDHDV